MGTLIYNVVGCLTWKKPSGNLNLTDDATIFTGTSVYLFNYLSGISVGAKQNKSRHLYDAFKGIIAGVYFNGVRVIDR